MRLLIHFARFGPYHHARLRAAAAELRPFGWEVIGLETASTDATYAWNEVRPSTDGEDGSPLVVTVFPGQVHEEITGGECRRSLPSCLEELAPDAVAIAGWGTLDARVSLHWCRKNNVKAIIMSETREVDGPRRWWKERIKTLIMRDIHGALVGGAAHRNYLAKLGIPEARIRLGYNVVDNAYFAAEATRWRGSMSGGSVSGEPLAVGGERDAVGGEGEVGRWPLADGGAVSPMPPYFLASNRFIERKNLVRLIEAYALFCRLPAANGQPPTASGPPPTASGPPPTPWSLVLLGDGQLRAQLIAQCHTLGLTVIEAAPWETGGQEGREQLAVGGESTKAGKEAAFEDAAILRPDDKSSTAHRQPPVDFAALRPSPLRSDCPPPTERPPTVFFPGFRQIDELPRFYAHAGAFIHLALEEPWGLVINEAMACGLPVLSGNNVGAAAELIEEGKNGWTFDAGSVEAIAGAMARLTALSEEKRLAMGLASAQILEERCPTSAFGRGLAELLK